MTLVLIDQLCLEASMAETILGEALILEKRII